MQTYSIKWTVLATKQDFLINADPRNVYFILHYHLFFRKEFIFRMFIFQWILYSNIRICFFGREIGHPLSTYAAGEMEGVIQNVYKCVQGEGGLKNWAWDTYVLNGWPQRNAVEYFLCIGSAKYTRALPPARKMLFSSIIITIILSYAIIGILSSSSIFESPQKKQASIF